MTQKQFANYVLQIEDLCKSLFKSLPVSDYNQNVIVNWDSKKMTVVLTTPDDAELSIDQIKTYQLIFDTDKVVYISGMYIINL